MTEEPPQSWPRRPSGTRPLFVDPITGELIETDAPPAAGSWTPPVPDAGHPAPGWAAPGQAPAAGAWARGGPVAGQHDHPAAVPGYPAPEWAAPGQPAGAAWPGPDHPASAAPGSPAPGYPAPGYPAPGYPAPQGYPVPPYPPAPYYGPARPTNGLAVASLVLGAVWLFWIGSVLALVFGYVSRGQIRRSGEGGDGLAIAGLVLGWVGVGFLALTVVAGALGRS